MVPYPTGGVSSQHLSTLQQDTLILSHEVSEAVTDLVRADLWRLAEWERQQRGSDSFEAHQT